MTTSVKLEQVSPG